ncbi:MAG: hypothetical protein JOZ98_00860 [Solirubrobacterales bacterium]|nr:hypothetical protein [Solirubrobacterales bacterium]
MPAVVELGFVLVVRHSALGGSPEGKVDHRLNPSRYPGDEQLGPGPATIASAIFQPLAVCRWATTSVCPSGMRVGMMTTVPVPIGPR